MQIEFTITAKNKELFNLKLTEQLMKVFNDLNIDNTKILAIQFKDADSFIIDNFISGQFCSCDGVYLHEGKYYWRNELYEIVQPYCKVCLISIAEKRFECIDYTKDYIELPMAVECDARS